MEEKKEETSQQAEPAKENQAQSKAGGEKSAEEAEKLKQQREEKKKEKARVAAEKKAKKAQAAEEKKSGTTKIDASDKMFGKFGDHELNRSQINPEERSKKVYTAIKGMSVDLVGQEVRIRARLHNCREQGSLCFMVLRESYETIQAVVNKKDTSNGFFNFAKRICPESIVEVVALVVAPEVDITGASNKTIELQISEVWCVNRSAPILPFQIADALTPCSDQVAEMTGGDKKEGEEEKKDQTIVVNQKTRLDNRIIDLRVPTNQAIMRLQSGVCQVFREFLYKNDFIEIHSPKLLGGTSEGGANVFRLKYFEKDACLAQSPQLYKQMALCGDFERVFEIGPVFRAENSNTNRHLCEFTGLDMEMTFKDHYFEVLDMLSDMLTYIFAQLETRFARELEVINAQYPFEPFVCKSPAVKLHFKEGVQMLKEAGIEQDPLDDLSTETEKALGRLVKEKHQTDFYMLYGYPRAARPFYTMLDPSDNNYTNSYDFFMRGEEITSGAQRVHCSKMLAERAKEFGIPPESIKDYIEAFNYGAPTHGGAGFGLERIVKFYCNLHNIRKCSLFPRDPQRLAP